MEKFAFPWSKSSNELRILPIRFYDQIRRILGLPCTLRAGDIVIAEFVHTLPCIDRVAAVSYTHLDVYKRQALHLLVRHRRGYDFTIYTHEHFRLPELFCKLFREVVRQVGEIILGESDDKEISRDDVIDITIRIAQCAVCLLYTSRCV